MHINRVMAVNVTWLSIFVFFGIPIHKGSVHPQTGTEIDSFDKKPFNDDFREHFGCTVPACRAWRPLCRALGSFLVHDQITRQSHGCRYLHWHCSVAICHVPLWRARGSSSMPTGWQMLSKMLSLQSQDRLKWKHYSKAFRRWSEGQKVWLVRCVTDCRNTGYYTADETQTNRDTVHRMTEVFHAIRQFATQKKPCIQSKWRSFLSISDKQSITTSCYQMLINKDCGLSNAYQ